MPAATFSLRAGYAFFFFLTHLSSSVSKTRDLWRYVLLVLVDLQAEALQMGSEGEQGPSEKEENK